MRSYSWFHGIGKSDFREGEYGTRPERTTLTATATLLQVYRALALYTCINKDTILAPLLYLLDTANKELFNLENWFSANEKINASKMGYQIISSTGKVEQMNLTLMGNNIERCWEGSVEYHFKLAGVRLDEGLTYTEWRRHTFCKFCCVFISRVP